MDTKRETAKHTPGPWQTFEPDMEHPSRARVGALDGQVDIYNAPLTRETEANARLIAAAPDLLEACKDAVVDITDFADPNGEFEFTPEGARSLINRLNRAIARAEGR